MAYVTHNHVTRDIKQPGDCPGCDEHWAKTKPITGLCPYCKEEVAFTIIIMMTWQCPHCGKKWVHDE